MSKTFELNLIRLAGDLIIKLAIRVKETWRVRVRHPLRQESQQGWKKYGRERYRVEGVLGC